MDCSTPGLHVHHQLLEFTQTHVHQVSMPFNHLILCCPLLLLPSIFPNIRVFKNESLHSMLSRFSRVWLCVTPEMAAHQAPLSLGFSRQEHWSGLPFPSPMHESGKWKLKVKLLSRVWLLATPWTATYQAPLSMGFSRQEYWSEVPLASLTTLHS